MNATCECFYFILFLWHISESSLLSGSRQRTKNPHLLGSPMECWQTNKIRVKEEQCFITGFCTLAGQTIFLFCFAFVNIQMVQLYKLFSYTSQAASLGSHSSTSVHITIYSSTPADKVNLTRKLIVFVKILGSNPLYFLE